MPRIVTHSDKLTALWGNTVMGLGLFSALNKPEHFSSLELLQSSLYAFCLAYIKGILKKVGRSLNFPDEHCERWF